MVDKVDIENLEKIEEEQAVMSNNVVMCQKTQETGVNNIKSFILEAITRLREQGLSYSQVGEKMGIAAGQVHMIESGKWYPKVRKVENRIFEKLIGKSRKYEEGGENGAS